MAIAALALGIGLNLGVFAVVDSIFLQPLAVDHASRLVKLTTVSRDAAFQTPVWEHVEANQRVMEAVAAYARSLQRHD